MGSLGALLLAVGYGADYSKPWRVMVMSAYGLIMAIVRGLVGRAVVAGPAALG